MLIFVQVCRTIDKKLNVFNTSLGSWRTNENNEIYKKEACVARMKTESEVKERLKNYQKLSIRSGLPEADIIIIWRTIRSWSSSEAKDWKLKLVKCCYSECIWLQKEWIPGATAISEELEDIGWLSTKEHRKRT